MPSLAFTAIIKFDIVVTCRDIIGKTITSFLFLIQESEIWDRAQGLKTHTRDNDKN